MLLDWKEKSDFGCAEGHPIDEQQDEDAQDGLFVEGQGITVVLRYLLTTAMLLCVNRLGKLLEVLGDLFKFLLTLNQQVVHGLSHQKRQVALPSLKVLLKTHQAWKETSFCLGIT